MRAGWKTSEFWLAIGGKVLLAVGAALHLVPGPAAAAGVAAVSAAYTIGRAITKSNAPGPDPSHAITEVGKAIVGALSPSSAELVDEPPPRPPAPTAKL
jgi:streptogramin lyase